MNNIHEKDWAEDSWSGHTGMDSCSDYSHQGEKNDKTVKDHPEPVTDPHDISEQDEHTL